MKNLFSFKMIIAMICFSFIVSSVKSQNLVLYDNFSQSDPWWDTYGNIDYININENLPDAGCFNATPCGTDQRVSREICSLAKILTVDNWKARIKVKFTNWYYPAHSILALTAGIGNPFDPNISQDAACIYLYKPLSSLENPKVYVAYRDGNGSFQLSSTGISVNLNTDYYFELSRASGSSVLILNSCNSSYTNILNSTNITISGSVDELSNVQMCSVINGSSFRTLTASFDDLYVYGNTIYGDYCTSYFDYSNSTNWTQVGTDVSIANGKVNFNNANDGESQRIYNSADFPSNAESFNIRFEFFPESIGTGGPGHMILALTSTSDDPFPLGGSFPNQNAISLNYVASPIGNDPSYRKFMIGYKTGTSSWTYPSYLTCSTATDLNMVYYISLVVVDATNYTGIYMDIYSDACFSNVIFSGKWDVTKIENLSFIQHGCLTYGSTERSLTGWIDNVCIHTIPSNKTFNSMLNTDKEAVELFEPSICPNPNSGIFTITFNNQFETRNELQIFDAIGRKIFSNKIFDNESTTIDLSNYDNGVYFVKIIGENNHAIIRKIIKE